MQLTAVYTGDEFRIHRASCRDIGVPVYPDVHGMVHLMGRSREQVIRTVWAEFIVTNRPRTPEDRARLTTFLPCCSDLPDTEPEGGKAVCAGCSEPIFGRPDGTWALVYQLAADTTICFMRDGQPDQMAYEDRQPHVPLTASGYDEGTPHFEVYAASPAGYDTKKHPTFIARSMAEHNARKYSRDGRAYVVEHVGADGKRSKVAVFRNGRKVRQS